MADKILATFRIDPSEWEAFKNAATASGTNASALLIEFVRTYPHKSVESPPKTTDSHLDTTENNCIDDSSPRLDSIEARLDKIEDSSLDNVVSDLVEKRLEAYLDKRIDEVRSQFEAQLEALRGKLKAR